MATKIVSANTPGGPAAERAGRALVLASFLSATGFAFVFPLLPIYMRQLVGPGPASALWAGLALAATPLGGALVSPFWGRLADRIGYRPMLLRALGSTALIIGLMALPDQPWQLVLLRALAGALGSFQAAAMAALTSWSRPQDLSRAVSRLQMASVLGAIVGPLLGGVIAAFLGVRFSALAGAATMAVGFVLVLRWFHEPARRGGRQRSTDVPFRSTLLWLPMLTLVAVQFTESSFNPILPLLLAQGGESEQVVASVAGLAISLSAAAAAASSTLAGRVFKAGVQPRAVVGMTLSLALLALWGMVAPLPWGVVALRVLCGGVAVGVAVAAYSAGGLAAPPSHRGTAYGWLSSSSMVGFAASPVAAGSLAAIDLRAVLALDTALCLVAAIAWVWSRGIAPAAEQGGISTPAGRSRESPRRHPSAPGPTTGDPAHAPTVGASHPVPAAAAPTGLEGPTASAPHDGVGAPAEPSLLHKEGSNGYIATESQGGGKR